MASKSRDMSTHRSKAGSAVLLRLAAVGDVTEAELDRASDVKGGSESLTEVIVDSSDSGKSSVLDKILWDVGVSKHRDETGRKK
jgi:hypothetical protein